MGAMPIRLPATRAPRVTVADPFPSRFNPRAASPALLLLISISLLWMNLPWITSLCEFTLFLAAGVLALVTPTAQGPRRILPLLLAAAIPLWGILGIVTGHAAYNYAAILTTLHWTTVPACLLLGTLLMRERGMRDAFLASLWLLAAAVTALELYQVLILGRFRFLSTGFPLMSSNLYAELTELLLPAVLATALRKGSRFWLGSILCALMLGTTVAAGARMGSILLLVEITAVFLLTRKASGYRALTWQQHGLPLTAILLAALALEGTNYLGSRLEQPNLLAGRTEVLQSALVMAQQHPALGFGMGAFPVVYPQFQHLDTDSFVNHAHNDYLEITADGGLPALLLWLALIAACMPSILKAPWALGTLALLVHALTDFPLYRLPVLALLALLLAAAESRAEETRSRTKVTKDVVPMRSKQHIQAA